MEELQRHHSGGTAKECHIVPYQSSVEESPQRNFVAKVVQNKIQDKP